MLWRQFDGVVKSSSLFETGAEGDAPLPWLHAEPTDDPGSAGLAAVQVTFAKQSTDGPRNSASRGA